MPVAESCVAPDQPSEEALIERSRAGDDEAFVALVRRHQDRLLRLAGRFLPTREDAEDVVQDAILAAYRQMARFRADASFSTWLGRITIYKALRMARRGRRMTSAGDRCEEGCRGDPDAATSLSVRDAVARLPEKLRLPVVLRFYEDLSGQEIADLLAWKQSTVWTRLYRGLARLREDLGGGEPA